MRPAQIQTADWHYAGGGPDWSRGVRHDQGSAATRHTDQCSTRLTEDFIIRRGAKPLYKGYRGSQTSHPARSVMRWRR